jgi:hypothetical protein
MFINACLPPDVLQVLHFDEQVFGGERGHETYAVNYNHFMKLNM